MLEYSKNDNSNSITSVQPIFLNLQKFSVLKQSDKKIVDLEGQSSCYPVSVYGNSCAVNFKTSGIMKEKYGIRSPFSNCASHIASTIIRALKSGTMSDENINSLYDNLQNVMKHFSQSSKGTGVLNKALCALEMNNIHMLAWGGTRMSGFFDASKQTSDILIF